MGAWSHESFGNDDACDWVYELEEHDGTTFLESTFDAVLMLGDEDIEPDVASRAIAAAEAVARLRGNFGVRDAYSESLDAWVEQVKLQPTAGLINKACRALDRILIKPSELLELWEESDESNAWHAAVEELKVRVNT